MQFVSLHTHTTHSHGDGFGLVSQHADRWAELGMTAVALTEHRGVGSHPQLEQECARVGVKPIFGCEFDVVHVDHLDKTRHFHQTVLAMDEEGYRNLNRLVTLAWRQSKRVPRLYTDQLLDRKLTRGLIVLSGCADSWLACTILGGKVFGEHRKDWRQEDAHAGRRLVEQYQQVYGDRYYLECQRFPQLERSTILNQLFLDISEVTGVRTAATADVHYMFAAENEMQRALHAAHRGGTVETMDADWEYDIPMTYPTSDEEIIAQFLEQEYTRAEAERTVFETARIAERCNVVLPKSPRVRYPITEEDWKPWT